MKIKKTPPVKTVLLWLHYSPEEGRADLNLITFREPICLRSPVYKL
ncbi:hypothetical protein NE567_00170 [Butyricimonas paravirosa]|nr:MULTISPECIES: hypothetical protein [Odoribacteraceae]MCQ4871967.1 hypothetical protein [Butyricimonas paravirosa]